MCDLLCDMLYLPYDGQLKLGRLVWAKPHLYMWSQSNIIWVSPCRSMHDSLYTLLIRVEAPTVGKGSDGEGWEPSCSPLTPIHSDAWVSLKCVKRPLSFHAKPFTFGYKVVTILIFTWHVKFNPFMKYICWKITFGSNLKIYFYIIWPPLQDQHITEISW